ncbi:MAG: SDR family NAD(P)-dependent oxidoreductase [Proteobacteria bacterium]|nr:SDR family NAD(P)-dependent oxidoreductase [Pseudomonadota bacterium]
MDTLRDRVAVITGAGSGIGEALAHACAEAGMHCALADVEPGKAEAVAAAVAKRGVRAFAARVDVTRFEEVEAFAARTRDELGGCHLLCNNAGVLVLGPTVERTLEDWEWVLGVNVKGVVHGVRAFVPAMIEAGEGGHVVNTASINGLIPFAAHGVYTTSKFAVVGLSECLRLDLAGAGIGVSVLCPGGVATQIARSQRNRPAELGEYQLRRRDIEAIMESGDEANATLIEPSRVAELTLEAVRRNELYVITHPGSKGMVEARCREILSAYDRAAKRDDLD